LNPESVHNRQAETKRLKEEKSASDSCLFQLLSITNAGAGREAGPRFEGAQLHRRVLASVEDLAMSSGGKEMEGQLRASIAEEAFENDLLRSRLSEMELHHHGPSPN